MSQSPKKGTDADRYSWTKVGNTSSNRFKDKVVRDDGGHGVKTMVVWRTRQADNGNVSPNLPRKISASSSDLKVGRQLPDTPKMLVTSPTEHPIESPWLRPRQRNKSGKHKMQHTNLTKVGSASSCDLSQGKWNDSPGSIQPMIRSPGPRNTNNYKQPTNLTKVGSASFVDLRQGAWDNSNEFGPSAMEPMIRSPGPRSRKSRHHKESTNLTKVGSSSSSNLSQGTWNDSQNKSGTLRSPDERPRKARNYKEPTNLTRVGSASSCDLRQGTWNDSLIAEPKVRSSRPRPRKTRNNREHTNLTNVGSASSSDLRQGAKRDSPDSSPRRSRKAGKRKTNLNRVGSASSCDLREGAWKNSPLVSNSNVEAEHSTTSMFGSTTGSSSYSEVLAKGIPHVATRPRDFGCKLKTAWRPPNTWNNEPKSNLSKMRSVSSCDLRKQSHSHSHSPDVPTIGDFIAAANLDAMKKWRSSKSRKGKDLKDYESVSTIHDTVIFGATSDAVRSQQVGTRSRRQRYNSESVIGVSVGLSQDSPNVRASPLGDRPTDMRAGESSEFKDQTRISRRGSASSYVIRALENARMIGKYRPAVDPLKTLRFRQKCQTGNANVGLNTSSERVEQVNSDLIGQPIGDDHRATESTDTSAAEELTELLNIITNIDESDLNDWVRTEITEVKNQIKLSLTQPRPKITYKPNHIDNNLDSLIEDVGILKGSFENQAAELAKLRRDTNSVYIELDQADNMLEHFEAKFFDMKRKYIIMEINSMKNNILIFGLRENDDAYDTEEAVMDFFHTYLQIDTDSIALPKAFRLGFPRSGITRAIKVIFQSYKDKEFVKRAKHRLKGTSIIVCDEYPKVVEMHRKQLYPVLREARREGRSTRLKLDTLFIDGEVYQGAGPGPLGYKPDIQDRGSLSDEDFDSDSGY